MSTWLPSLPCSVSGAASPGGCRGPRKRSTILARLVGIIRALSGGSTNSGTPTAAGVEVRAALPASGVTTGVPRSAARSVAGLQATKTTRGSKRDMAGVSDRVEQSCLLSFSYAETW